jgi:hypothetical protein
MVLSELLPVGFGVVREQLTVSGTGYAIQMNFYSPLTKFRAKVDDLNASAALDEHASRRFHCESRDVYPVVPMLNAMGLN